MSGYGLSVDSKMLSVANDTYDVDVSVIQRYIPLSTVDGFIFIYETKKC